MRLCNVRFGNFFHAAGTHRAGIHGCHDCAEHLVGADVAGSLFAANVLLACLKGENEYAVAVGINGFTDDSAGQIADEFAACCHKARVRAAEAHGNAERLCIADSNIRTVVRRAFDSAEADGVDIADEQCLCAVNEG